MGGVNSSFDERILDLCDAIIAAAEGGPQTRVRRAGERLAENIGQVVNDTVLMMAREIMGDLAEAVSILGNAEVRAALGARGLWDVVAAIDRLMRRPRRPTLSHLRRGRAGMTVLAWLADMLDGSRDGGVVVEAEDSVVSAAVDWVDETLTLVQSEMGEPTSSPARPQPSWADLAR
jgi:hypothetical protein